MKPTDVIKQLIGDASGWDQHDLLSFSFYDVVRDGITYPAVSVCLDAGVVEFFNADNEVVLKFAIKATLEPLLKS